MKNESLKNEISKFPSTRFINPINLIRIMVDAAIIDFLRGWRIRIENLPKRSTHLKDQHTVVSPLSL